MRYSISATAEYGDLTRGPRLSPSDDPARTCARPSSTSGRCSALDMMSEEAERPAPIFKPAPSGGCSGASSESVGAQLCFDDAVIGEERGGGSGQSVERVLDAAADPVICPCARQPDAGVRTDLCRSSRFPWSPRRPPVVVDEGAVRRTCSTWRKSICVDIEFFGPSICLVVSTSIRRCTLSAGEAGYRARDAIADVGALRRARRCY